MRVAVRRGGPHRSGGALSPTLKAAGPALTTTGRRSDDRRVGCPGVPPSTGVALGALVVLGRGHGLEVERIHATTVLTHERRSAGRGVVAGVVEVQLVGNVVHDLLVAPSVRADITSVDRVDRVALVVEPSRPQPATVWREVERTPPAMQRCHQSTALISARTASVSIAASSTVCASRYSTEWMAGTAA